MLVMMGCARFPTPTFVEHSKPTRPQHPMLEPFPRSELKKFLHGRGWHLQCREKFWESITRVQPSGVTACCLVNRGHPWEGDGGGREPRRSGNWRRR